MYKEKNKLLENEIKNHKERIKGCEDRIENFEVLFYKMEEKNNERERYFLELLQSKNQSSPANLFIPKMKSSLSDECNPFVSEFDEIKSAESENDQSNDSNIYFK